MPLPSKEMIEKAMVQEHNIRILTLTNSKIKQEKNDILQRLQLDREKLKLFHTKLKSYRFVETTDDIIIGNYIRWINISNPEKIVLTNGAIVTDFKEVSQTVYLVCKTNFGRFFNVDINKCLIFQKFNLQEETLLSVINYLEKNNINS
jgi:hypothetical protein|tara:strand:+ start:1935 stop:2378 length:444 start_codon:yes stop_codon:yes gene_type:complete